MSQPVPWTIGCLGWHVFRLPRQNIGTLNQFAARDYLGVRTWMEENLRGPWAEGVGYQLVVGTGMSLTPYYVRDASDAVLMKLTWSEYVEKPRFGGQ